MDYLTQNQRIDEHWMNAAITQAKSFRGRTSPNPKVGAVVLNADGQLVGQGAHLGPGTDHAEVVALDQAGEQAYGGTLYVTLEPCSHHGRTPPCTDRIIKAQIKRVVAATVDPNPLVQGMGFKKLQDAGIIVDFPIMEKEARLMNKAFITWATCRRPYVLFKSAQSIDGKVATHTGHSQWITSPEARADAHRFRASVDAILVGIGTVLADDPLLTARPQGTPSPHQPLRVILDRQGRLPETAKCLSQPHGQTLVALGRQAIDKQESLMRAGAHVWVSPTDGPIHIPALLEHLAAMDVTSLLIEGGPTVSGAFWDLDLVDETLTYIAPRLIGGQGALSALGGRGIDKLTDRVALTDVTVSKIGPDICVRGRMPRPYLNDD